MLDHPEIGSICSGGRYDNLAEYYTDRQLPGVGISIGATRLFYVLQEQKMLNEELPTAPADVLILPMTPDITAAAEAATFLRSRGVRTQLYTEQKKFKAKMGYADKLGIPFVAFLGEDEIAAGTLSLKNMKTGEQQLLTLEEAVASVTAALSAHGAEKLILG
jgi:histidyl-tRNA synthetase